MAKGDERRRLQAEHDALESQLPDPPPTLATVLNDTEAPTPVHLLNRGDHTKPLQPLAPRPPGVLLPEDTPALPPEVEDPRSHLAEWITSPEHPLTARVAVNRIWQGYFGQGIVDTPERLRRHGRAPEPSRSARLPSERTGRSGLERETRAPADFDQQHISAGVPQSRNQEELGLQLDASNRLLWHGPRRRLSAEEVRDAMLAVAGELNLAYGGKSVMLPVEEALVDLLYDPTQWRVPADQAQHRRRSIYLLAKRNLRLPFMEVFDQPPLLTSCARRETSTHAPQSLELLNGPIANELAARLAARLDREAGRDLDSIVSQAYLLAAGRPPTDDEALIARTFLAENSLREFALAMFNLNSFLYLN